MEYNYEKVAQSLRLMYVGNMIIIASILCTILAWIIPPLIFLVSMAVLGGTVISLVGLVKLRSEHRAYRNAVITLVIVFVVGLFANDETIFGALMSMAQDICNLLMTYFVIKGTMRFYSQGALPARWSWEKRHGDGSSFPLGQRSCPGGLRCCACCFLAVSWILRHSSCP